MTTVEQVNEAWREMAKADEEQVTEEEERIAEELYARLMKENKAEREAIVLNLYNEINGSIYRTIWLYTFVIALLPRPEWVKELQELIIEAEELSWQTLYFLYEQIFCKIFRKSELETKENTYLKWKLLDKAYERCKADVSIPLKRIPKQERDEDMAVVIVEQFLSDAHGPTKTALDRCYTLKTELGKKVLLINTAELLTASAQIPCFGILYGTYFPDQTEKTMQYWRNEAIPYFQCDNDMPNIPMMEMLLQTIYQLKPGIVVCVGGSSLFAGLVNEIIPVLTVGTTQSGIAVTLADYQTVSKQLILENEDIVKRAGRKSNHIIKGEFTFSLKEQTEFVTRKEVGLPENAFVIGVVGARLDTEITERELALFERVVREDVVIFLIGSYNSYADIMEKNPLLKPYVYYQGFCGDILSRVELCDLYLNPLRKGGGTSAVEAMYKGKPVVTISYGDVAGIVGEAFCCADDTEMEQQIKRYISDSEYYESQSQKAIEVSDRYLDSKREFKRIVEEYLTREDGI